MIEQKHLILTEHNGCRFNFFFTPGSVGSLEEYLIEGWLVKDIREGPGMTSVLLERSSR